MAKKSGGQMRRRAGQAFQGNRDREPAPVVVKFRCPVCNGPHRRDACPRRDDGREVARNQ